MDLPWSEWLPLNEPNIAKCEDKNAVYRIRRKEGTVPRVQGCSEILYIGSTDETKERQSVKKRLLGLIRHGHVARRQLRLFEKELKMTLEFSVAYTNEPKTLQDKLLMEYFKAHYEQPPANNARSKLLKQYLRETVS